MQGNLCGRCVSLSLPIPNTWQEFECFHCQWQANHFVLRIFLGWLHAALAHGLASAACAGSQCCQQHLVYLQE